MTPKGELLRVGAEQGWIKRRVCGALEITRPTLDLWIAKYGIEWGKDRLYASERKVVKHTRKHSKASGVGVSTSRDVAPRLEPMDATATAEATEKDPRNPASVRVRESVWMRMRLVALKRKTSAAALAEEAFEKFLENVDDNGEPIR